MIWIYRILMALYYVSGISLFFFKGKENIYAWIALFICLGSCTTLFYIGFNKRAKELKNLNQDNRKLTIQKNDFKKKYLSTFEKLKSLSED